MNNSFRHITTFFDNLLAKVGIVDSAANKNKKDMDNKILEFQSHYYRLRAKLDISNSKSYDEDSFNKNLSSRDFQKNISNPFKELCGIHGGGYAIIDKPQNKIFFIQNKLLKKDQNLNIPFYSLPYKLNLTSDILFAIESNDHKADDLVTWMIDTMFESYYDNMELDDDERKAPDFFKNMPPFQSSFAFKPLPFEQKIRNKKLIDGYYACAGEVLFFVYAWRVLMYYAQRDGLEANLQTNIELLGEEIIDQAKSYTVWEKSNWTNIDNSLAPEKKWLIKLQDNKKWWRTDRGNNIPDYLLIEKAWDAISKYTDPKSKVTRPFIATEWKLLGLMPDSPHHNLARKVLTEYCRHVIRHIPFQINMQHPEIFPDRINNVHEINTAVDFILTIEKEHRDAFISQLFSEDKPDEYWHYVYKKIMLCSFSYDTEDPYRFWNISEALQMLHTRTRFPVMPLFFQIALSKDHQPREFFACPIAKSFSNAFEVPFYQREDGNIEKFNKIAFAMLTIEPIRLLGKGAYSFTVDDSKHPLYDDDAKISDIAILRMRCIQDFMTVVSGPTVDRAFYDKIFKKAAEEDTRQAQFFAQAHEIHKLVRFIQPETPGFIIDEIRRYFVVLYGAVNYVLEELEASSMSNDFDFLESQNLQDFVRKALFYATRIEVLTNIAIDGKVPNITPYTFESDFRNEIVKTQVFFHSIPSIKLPVKEHADKVTLLYFYMALICAFRNIIKHHEVGTPINIVTDKKSIKITNKYNAILKKSSLNLSKDHPGSTIYALKYFVKEYENTHVIISQRVSNEKWETILPMPEILTKLIQPTV